MKRAHRKTHLLMWMLLGPAAIVGLIVAVNVRVTVWPFGWQKPPVVQHVPNTMPPAKEVTPK